MKNPLVKKPETNSQNSTNSQKKYPETLEKQRDYYLKLYEKWANWQQETPEKLPEGFRTKEEFDFEEILESVKNYDIESVYFFMLVENDKEMDEIYFNNYFLDENINVSLNYEYGKTEFFEIVKPVIFIAVRGLHEKCEFCEMKGKLNLKCIHSGNKKIIFEDCNFSHITLENFDRGYFSPETNEYLNQMDKEGKLTLINCTWSGLPALRENNRVEIPSSFNRRNFSFPVNDQTKAAFVKYFAGFQRFIQTAKGRKIGFELANKNDTIDLVIYSDNQEDLDEMDVWISQFILYAYEFIKNGKLSPIDVDFDRTSDYDRKISLIEHEFRVSDLRTQLKISQLSEFQAQQEILRLTQQVDELFLELQDIKKPVLCLEGEIDKDYLKFAANILGFGDLFQKVEILTLNGESELKKIWNGYNSQQFNVNNLHKKALLLFDCDVSFPDWQQKEEKLYSWKIPKLNNLIPKGIENLFGSKLILVAKKHRNQFVDKTIQEIRGKESIKYEINSDEKRNFCNWIINRNDKNDFENFTSILVKIQEVLT